MNEMNFNYNHLKPSLNKNHNINQNTQKKQKIEIENQTRWLIYIEYLKLPEDKIFEFVMYIFSRLCEYEN